LEDAVGRVPSGSWAGVCRDGLAPFSSARPGRPVELSRQRPPLFIGHPRLSAVLDLAGRLIQFVATLNFDFQVHADHFADSFQAYLNTLSVS